MLGCWPRGFACSGTWNGIKRRSLVRPADDNRYGLGRSISVSAKSVSAK